VNLERLAQFEAGSVVDPDTFQAEGIVKDLKDGIKILGTGELNHALHVRAHKFSKSASEKIQKAGGTVEIIARSTQTSA
jgi:large subunit ribosomal protein L15